MTPEQAALAALGIALAGFFAVEAIGGMVGVAAAMTEGAAIGSAIGGMIAAGGLGVLAGGITIAVVGGVVLGVIAAGAFSAYVIAPAIAEAMRQNALRNSGAIGQSGEETGDMAAARQRALDPQPIHINFNQLLTDPTFTAPSNVPRGNDPAATDTAGVGGGQVANPPGQALQLDLTQPGQLNLDLTPAPDVDGGLNLDAVDAVSLDATVSDVGESGEYGWVDGVYQHYDDDHPGYVHHAVTPIAWPPTWMLYLLTAALGWPAYRRIRA